MSSWLTQGELGRLLREERDQWERYSVAPGLESVMLLVDGLELAGTEVCDLAFLFFALGIALDLDAEPEVEELIHIALAAVVDELTMAATDDVAFAPWMSVANWKSVVWHRVGEAGAQLAIAPHRRTPWTYAHPVWIGAGGGKGSHRDCRAARRLSHWSSHRRSRGRRVLATMDTR